MAVGTLDEVQYKLMIARKNLSTFIVSQIDQGATEAELHCVFIAHDQIAEVLDGKL